MHAAISVQLHFSHNPITIMNPLHVLGNRTFALAGRLEVTTFPVTSIPDRGALAGYVGDPTDESKLKNMIGQARASGTRQAGYSAGESRRNGQ
jgi:hypothetical protein